MRHADFFIRAKLTGILKLDFKNAFNALDRNAMTAAVSEKLFELLPLTRAVYGRRSHLVFSSYRLVSSSGVQQGDPLGQSARCVLR